MAKPADAAHSAAPASSIPVGEAAVATVFATLDAFLVARLPAGDRLCVALSGGRDSLVLVDALHRLALPNPLSALHVNHGLSPHAADWARFCADFCAARDIPLQVVELPPIVAGGEGLEAAARRQRYAAFARCGADWLALAHHRDDQAETLLLRLLRGAGVAGAAGMPAERALDLEPDVGTLPEGEPLPAAGALAVEQAAATARQAAATARARLAPRLIRPLLDLPRATLTAYAVHHGLRWIEDESNADCRHRRNFIRHQILPPLSAVFPGAGAALARATGHFAEAAALLDDLAALDRQRLAPAHGRLPVAALQTLPIARARNLLRHELKNAGMPMPETRWLDEALRQLATAVATGETCIDWAAGSLRVFRGELFVLPPLPPPSAPMFWPAAHEYSLYWGGARLRVQAALGAGISRARLSAGALQFSTRRGGERLQPDPRRPRRSLKKLLHERALPPWLRERLPLLWCGDALVWVAGIGVDAAFACAEGEAGFQLVWEGVEGQAGAVGAVTEAVAEAGAVEQVAGLAAEE